MPRPKHKGAKTRTEEIAAIARHRGTFLSSDIAAATGLGKSSVSVLLCQMRDAGLVTSTKNGHRNTWRWVDGELEPVPQPEPPVRVPAVTKPEPAVVRTENATEPPTRPTPSQSGLSRSITAHLKRIPTPDPTPMERHLDALVATGVFGDDHAEVVRRLVQDGIRRAMVDGWIERSGTGRDDS